MTLVFLITLACAAVVSGLLTLLVRRVALRRGFIDRPGGHKGHASPVALGGGIAIYLTIAGVLLGGTLLARIQVGLGDREIHLLPAVLLPHVEGIASRLGVLLGILGGGLVLHLAGLWDDSRPMGWGWKLLIQVLVTVAVVVGLDVRAAELLGPVPSTLLTVTWLVLIINAFNFLDNMDGLSAGVAVLAGSILAVSAARTGQVFVPVMSWTLVGALLGFLWYNFAPARIFMGDAGSMVIGYFLGVLTVMTTYIDPGQAHQPAAFFTPLVVLAVPLYDVGSVVVHRLRAGDSPFRGDRRHFSHRLVRRGMSVRAAVLTIYLATGATGLGAVLLPRAGWGAAMAIFAQTLLVVMMIALLEHTAPAGTAKA